MHKRAGLASSMNKLDKVVLNCTVLAVVICSLDSRMLFAPSTVVFGKSLSAGYFAAATSIAALGWTAAISVRVKCKPWLIVVFAFSAIAQLIIGFALLYRMISVHTPAEFSRPLSPIVSLYYSVTTFTTTGYGDIVPRMDLAQMIASAEMLSGFVSSALVLAIVVAVVLRARE